MVVNKVAKSLIVQFNKVGKGAKNTICYIGKKPTINKIPNIIKHNPSIKAIVLGDKSRLKYFTKKSKLD